MRTEPIDLAGMNGETLREVRISRQRGNVRVEDDQPIRVRLVVEPEMPPEPIVPVEEESAAEEQAF